MTALHAARQRLEQFVFWEAPIEPFPLNDPRAQRVTKLRRMLDEVERCARIAAVEQWTSGRPF